MKTNGLTIWPALTMLLSGCHFGLEFSDSPDSGDTASETESTGTDGDTDTDTDGDTDGDTDVDGDSDADTDVDTGTDVDTDTDTDTDNNVDSGTGTDSDTLLPDSGDSDTASDPESICAPSEIRACEGTFGNCSKGIETCLKDGSGWGECSVAAEDKDSCEPGDDANCNGIPNEGCSCTEGETQPCGPEKTEGICQKGTLHCEDGSWSSDCVDAVMPEERDCGSNLDNDCDGFADNIEDAACICAPGATRSCDPYGKNGVGICAKGTRTCSYVNGKTSATEWGECNGAIAPQEEVCDPEGIDEDCDGSANEDCACTEGQTQPCGTSAGVCETGTMTCRDGAWPQDECVGEVPPGPRDCRSEHDNDCDNVPDNRVDDVCKCLVGSSQACDTGKYGICGPGTRTCIAGPNNETSNWGPCNSNEEPGPELCNNDNVDENCDGSPNDGCECINGSTENCGTNVGVCEYGTRTCANGQWGNCVGGVTPQEEICDANADDEDCDGTSNENCFTGGPCVFRHDQSETAFVFASGKDGGIYRATAPIAGDHPWERVPDLDASVLMAGDEYRIDCDGTNTIAHIVGLGNMPVGRIKHATVEPDLTATPFENAPLTTLFDTSPSVSSSNSDGSYRFSSKLKEAIGEVAGMVSYSVDATGAMSPFPTQDNARPIPIEISLESAVGETDYMFTNGRFVQFVAFGADGYLQFVFWNTNISGYSWTVDYFAPPPGKAFQYSPAICRYPSMDPINNAHRSRIVISAGNRLWMTTNTGNSETEFGPWQQLSNVDISSAPDCDVAADSTVHIVAKTQSDTVIYLTELNGLVTEEELKAF